MAKSLFMILASFVISTSVSFGEDACSHYENKNCVHPNILKNGHFVNQWSVYLPGMTKDQARQLLEENGFDYLGEIMDGVDLHLVTKKGTQEKHAMPNDRIIELLKRHEKVHSVAQKHVLGNSQEEVYNIIDEDDVRCESLDPYTIILNDGWDNLVRITEFEAAEAAAVAAAAAAAAASDNIKEATDADDGEDRNNKQREKRHSDASADDKSRSDESSDSSNVDPSDEN